MSLARRTRRWIPLIATTLLLAACSQAEGGSDTADPATAATSPSSSSVDESSPIEGTWQGGKVDRVLLIAGGLTKKEADTVLKYNQDATSLVSTLRLQDGIWAAFASSDGGADVHAQSGTYTVNGHTIVMLEDIRGGIRYEYQWTISDGQLSIELFESNAGKSFGISDDAFQFALYEATPMRPLD
jgi:hypothetical protein